jgi:hypothetical protein
MIASKLVQHVRNANWVDDELDIEGDCVNPCHRQQIIYCTFHLNDDIHVWGKGMSACLTAKILQILKIPFLLLEHHVTRNNHH